MKHFLFIPAWPSAMMHYLFVPAGPSAIKQCLFLYAGPSAIKHGLFVSVGSSAIKHCLFVQQQLWQFEAATSCPRPPVCLSDRGRPGRTPQGSGPLPGPRTVI